MEINHCHWQSSIAIINSANERTDEETRNNIYIVGYVEDFYE